jgi:molybdate transport system substrate-binding protein
MNFQGVVATAVLLSALGAGSASAVEITVLSTQATEQGCRELLPKFEKASGDTVKIVYTGTLDVKKRVAAGEPFDALIMASTDIDDFLKSGTLVPGSRVDIAKSGVGIGVPAGAPKPDISTTEAFKRALLEAKSIGYVEQGASGIYLKGLFERMGLTEQLKSKTKLLPGSNPAAHAVANGEVEIGMTQISEILPYAGAELVGPLPADIQLYTVFAAAVGTGAKEAAAANALLKFLTAPAAFPVLKAKGLSPG